MSISIKYALDTRRAKEDKTFPLVMRVIINRRTVLIPSGYSLLLGEWDHKNQQVKSKSKSIEQSSGKLNVFLAKRSVQVREYLSELNDNDEMLSTSYAVIKNRLKEILHGSSVGKMDLFLFMDQQMELLLEAHKYGSFDSTKTLKRSLKNYCNSEVLSFTEVNYEFLKGYEASHFSRGSIQGSLAVYLRTLRSIYNKAIKQGIVHEKYYPFKDYKIKSGSPQKRAISKTDYLKVKKAQLDNSSAVGIARNYYVASFILRGINWIDLCYLKRDNFSKDWNRVSYIRRKTKKRFTLEVLPDLLEIIKIFQKKELDDVKGFIFPVIKESMNERGKAKRIKSRRKKINGYLKKLAQRLAIDSFTYYSARHSWGTISRDLGLEISYIKEGYGHATEEQTQDYLNEVSNKEVDLKINQFYGKLMDEE